MPWVFVLQVANWFRILFKMSKGLDVYPEAGQIAGHYREITRKLPLPIRLKLVKKFFQKKKKKKLY